MPQPGPRRGACPQARRPARSHRAVPGPDPGCHRPRQPAPAGQRQDRDPGRQGPRQVQGRQTLRAGHQRRPLLVHKRRAAHRPRNRPRRPLRDPHQPRGRRPQPQTWWAPTRGSPGRRTPSATTTWTSRSAPSATARRNGSGPTCSSACSPTTSTGTCVVPSLPCSSPTTTGPRPRRRGPARWRPPNAPPKPNAKARTKRTDDGQPVHSFKTLLADLATVVANRVQPTNPALPAFDVITTPSPPPTAGLRPARGLPPPRS